jgi:hypothetical protein
VFGHPNKAEHSGNVSPRAQEYRQKILAVLVDMQEDDALGRVERPGGLLASGMCGMEPCPKCPLDAFKYQL